MNRTQKRKLIKTIAKVIPGKKLAASAVILGAFGAVMYYKNRLIPKYADDYPYSFVWEGDKNGNLSFGKKDHKRVKTLKDLFRSQWSHYLTWDGRTIAESLVQTFLMCDDKKPFDRANTAVMLAQLGICASIGSGSITGLKDISPKKALLLTAGFYACAPHLIATCFWLTGSMNYLWMGLLQSLFVLPYSMNYHGNLEHMPRPLILLMGLFAGWSTETGAGAALMLSLMSAFHAKVKGRYRSWMTWGIAGALAGLALLLMAPGNRKKFRIEQEESDTLPASLDEMLPGYVPVDYLYTPLMFKLWFKDGFMATILRELPLQIPVAAYFLQKNRDPHTTVFILGLEAAVLAVPTVMMLSPEYPRRATYPSILYLLPAAACALDHLEIGEISSWSTPAKAVFALGAAALGINLLSGLIVDADLSCQIEDQVEIIKNNREKELICVDDVALAPLYTALSSDRSITYDVCMGICFDNADDPYNMAAAAYYGAKKICCKATEHPYEKKGFRNLLYQIVTPVKSLIRRTKEIWEN